MKKVELSLLLNAHLPFVRHPEYEHFLEENWLYEAISETYLPLLRVFHRLDDDNIKFSLTMSFSPTLVTMLQDPVLQNRYVGHLKNQLDLAEKELERTADDPAFFPLAQMYHQLYTQNLNDFQDMYQGFILRGFNYFQKKGNLEILTTAASHCFMPFYQDYPENARVQIQAAIDYHCSVFSRSPRGIWLPDCAYYPGLDYILREFNMDYFFVAAHGVFLGDKLSGFGSYAPVNSPAGLAAFPRDLISTNQIWSETEGYPGDPVYRDFYRDIGFDLPLEYVGPYMHAWDGRVFTGFKYYRVTGKTDQKKVYDPEMAHKKVQEHAENYIYNRVKQAEKILSMGMDRTPLIVSPFDAELFGHWWFEGGAWLEAFFRKLVDYPEVSLSTPTDYLARHPVQTQVSIPYSSWGTKGYGETWLDGSNDWIYRHTHRLVERMQELVGRFPNETGRRERALNQAAREVLLSQASDWPLIIKSGTTVEYATKRIKEHISNFTRIYESLSSNELDTEWLTSLERRNNFMPQIDYRLFGKRGS